MNKKTTVIIDIDLADIATDYINNAKKNMEVMYGLLEQKDFKKLEVLGHRLKGNAGGYGFDQMGFIGADLETATQKEDYAQTEKAIKMLDQYLKNLEYVFEKIT